MPVGAFCRRRTPDHCPLEPDLFRAFQLLGALVDVLERDQCNRVQPARIVGSKVRDPIVVNPKTRTLQIGIMQPEQGHAQGRVQHLSLHTIDVLNLDALGRVPTAGARRLVALVLVCALHEFAEFFSAAAGRKSARDRKGGNVGRHENKRAAVLTPDNARRAIAKFLVQPLGPEIRGLGHVRVGGDYLDWCCCHGSAPPSLMSSRRLLAQLAVDVPADQAGGCECRVPRGLWPPPATGGWCPNFQSFHRRSNLDPVSASSLPFLRLSGPPRAQGRQHGDALRESISEVRRRWRESLAQRFGIHPDSFIEAFLAQTEFVAAMRHWTPALLEEIEGIAEGSGRSLPETLAFQFMDEEWWFGAKHYRQTSVEANHCSIIASRGRDGQPPILAQNMDLRAYLDGGQALISTAINGGPRTTVMTICGMIGTRSADE